MINKKWLLFASRQLIENESESEKVVEHEGDSDTNRIRWTVD